MAQEYRTDMTDDAVDTSVKFTPGGEAANAVARGTLRFLVDAGYTPLTELTLANGRRADIVALDRKGTILIVEIKSCLADYRTDAKWTEYLDYCDLFGFAVDQDFPVDVLPQEHGLILADRFGAEIARPYSSCPVNPARRKAVTLLFARTAALRINDQLGEDR